MITICQAGEESFEVAFRLLLRFYREEGFRTSPADMRTSLSAVIDGPDSGVFLACQGEQAVGVATVTTSVGVEYGLSAELEDLYVLPEARCSGVATGLIEAVCAWCEQKDCTAVLITVTPEGQVAHNLVAFYGRRGFSATGRVILERWLPDEPPARDGAFER